MWNNYSSLKKDTDPLTALLLQISSEQHSLTHDKAGYSSVRDQASGTTGPWLKHISI